MGKALSIYENIPLDLMALGNLQLFRQVNLAGLEALLQNCPSLSLARGDTLISPGQPNPVAYLVLSGNLQVFDGGDPARPIGSIAPGECVGLLSLIDRQPCHVSVICDQDCRLLALDEERLLALINTPSAIARNVLLTLMQYLRSKDSGAPERGRLQTRIERNSQVDAVTGLHNQRWLDGMIDRLIMRAAMDSKPLTVMALEVTDLDGFVREFGPEIGDQAVSEVAKTINAHVRPTDFLARHESGRMILLLPETALDGAEVVAARIHQSVAETAIEIPGACRLPPMQVALGCVQMKAFVAGRKLVDDAIAAIRHEPAAPATDTGESPPHLAA